MTEPIKTWLRPLDDDDPSIEVLQRARRGPNDSYGAIDTSSPSRSRLGAAAVALVVFAVAVVFAWNAFSPSDTTASGGATATPTAQGGSDAPSVATSSGWTTYTDPLGWTIDVPGGW